MISLTELPPVEREPRARRLHETQVLLVRDRVLRKEERIDAQVFLAEFRTDVPEQAERVLLAVREEELRELDGPLVRDAHGNQVRFPGHAREEHHRRPTRLRFGGLGVYDVIRLGLTTEDSGQERGGGNGEDPQRQIE